MMIACLGWGSLIWNPKQLRIRGDWSTNGPAIPIEFARQSNDGRISLVVTPGAPNVSVLWARLDVEDIVAAKQDLANREEVKAKHLEANIGYWTSERASSHPETAIIGPWAKGHGLDGVVWTALRPKLANEYRTPDQDEVVKYLAALKGEGRTRAEIYCRRAPAQIRTPYRAAIEAALGWKHESMMTNADGAVHSDGEPLEYPFLGVSEERSYRVFPDELENNELIAFHGTAEANLKAIIDGGFSFAGSLQSLSFARTSPLALKYACEARTEASPNGCILVVRFSSLKNVAADASIIHVYKVDLQPKIIGYCIIPASYAFV